MHCVIKEMLIIILNEKISILHDIIPVSNLANIKSVTLLMAGLMYIAWQLATFYLQL